MNIFYFAGLGLLLIIVAFLGWKYKPIRINKKYFYQEWKDLQKLLADKSTWIKSHTPQR